MARPNAYVPRNPDDIIRAGDWNEIQIRAREEIQSHAHTGGDQGVPIGRAGIQTNAIDGTRIDPASTVTVANLTVTNLFKVGTRTLLAEVDALLSRATDLETRASNLEKNKLDVSGGAITGTLKIAGNLGVGSTQATLPARLSLGMDWANTKFALYDNPTDLYGMGIQPNQFRFHLGNVAARFSFLNSVSGSEVLTIQGNGRVGIGVANPQERLSIAGAGSTIELGVGLSKEANAGKIGYQRFSPNALDIMGAGATVAERRIRLWAEGGTYLRGPLNLEQGDAHISNYPANDTTPARTSIRLHTRGTNGANILWGLYTAAVGGGDGVDPNAFEIWHEGASATPRLRILPNGNTLLVPSGGFVGIGTQNPASTLDVSGNINATGVLKVAGGLGIGSAQANLPARLSLGTDLANTKIALHDSPTDLYGMGIQAGQFRFHLGNAAARFSFLNSVAGVEIFTLQGNGRVGIGTATPQEMLSLAGAGSTIELGAGLTKEVNAGKIAYQKFSSNALDIVGAGATGAERRIRLWAEGGAYLRGSLNLEQGDAYVIGGKVGIGTSSPQGRLDVHGDVRISGSRLINKNGFGVIQMDTNDVLRINPDWKFARIDLIGAVGIGDGGLAIGEWTLQPKGRLVVTEHLFVGGGIHEGGTLLSQKYASRDTLVASNNAHWVCMQSDRNLVVYTRTSTDTYPVWSSNTAVSDLALKRDVRSIDDAMNRLRRLRGVSFHWQNDEMGTERELGVIAQEVEIVFPELINAIGDGTKLVKYEKFVPVLIQALKEQDERIIQFEERLCALEVHRRVR